MTDSPPPRTSDADLTSDFAAFQSELIRTAVDLSRLAGDAKAMGDDALHGAADERLQHLISGAFVVSVVSEFNRGKSTLSNALLGAPVMPADVLPSTATFNRVVYGREPRATIHLRSGERLVIPLESLADYVTKSTDDAAARAAGIEEARIELPTRLCLINVQLLDTPGLGDEAAMTERTLAKLPRIDAALLVLSAISPLAQTELSVLATLVQYVSPSRVFIVVSQIDLL